MLQINLLNQQRREVLKKQQQGTRFTFIGIGILLLSIGLTGISVYLSSRTQNQLTQITSDIKTVEVRISNYTLLVGQHNTIKNRISMIEGLYQDKEMYIRKINLLDQIYDNNGVALINRFNFGGSLSRNEFEFGGQSPDLANYHQFSKLISTTVEPYEISEISLNQLSRNPDKNLVFSYLVNL